MINFVNRFTVNPSRTTALTKQSIQLHRLHPLPTESSTVPQTVATYCQTLRPALLRSVLIMSTIRIQRNRVVTIRASTFAIWICRPFCTRKRTTAMLTSFSRRIGCRPSQLRQPILPIRRHAAAVSAHRWAWAATPPSAHARRRRVSVSVSTTIRKISSRIIITAPAVTRPATKRIKCWSGCLTHWPGWKDSPAKWSHKRVQNPHPIQAIRIKVFSQKYFRGEFIRYDSSAKQWPKLKS